MILFFFLCEILMPCCIEFLTRDATETRLQAGNGVLILEFQRKKNMQNSFGDVKTGKTSLSAWINIWINPGFLMQSEA